MYHNCIKPVFMGKVLEFSNKRKYEVNLHKCNTSQEKRNTVLNI